MIAAEAYVAFCLAALALAAVPGPTVTVIIANSLRFGARAGLLNVAGTIAAGLVWLALATLGLGAAIRVMGIWFDLLRYAGAIYLIWLGLRLLFSKGSAFDGRAATGAGAHGFFWQGFVVLMSNPKVLVLFGMLIPPFLGANGDIERGTLLLGGTFIIIAAVTDTVYALLAGQAGSWMSRSRIRAVEVVSGTFLAAAGVWMALKGRA
ncbi:MAG: LysE family translocator [Rhizobiales bacterium]|nr:LysE family translocator [Hyphomicrobiales bacterium]